MDDSDINDIFKDFEHKVGGKKEALKPGNKILKEEESLTESYKQAEKALKEKYKEKKEALKKKNEPQDHKSKGEFKLHPILSKKIQNYERLGYILVIVLLLAYIGFGHTQGRDSPDQQVVTAAAVIVEDSTKESDTNNLAEESQEEQDDIEEEKEVAEENALSGKISLSFVKISSEVVDEDNDLGYIKSVTFTIDNGKDKNLNPIVNVFAYDPDLDKSWETTSRGVYSGAAVTSGSKKTGTINLVPKTFRNLDLEKTIRLTLNDTDDGFITTVNKKITIS
jgi:hypothetical protein